MCTSWSFRPLEKSRLLVEQFRVDARTPSTEGFLVDLDPMNRVRVGAEWLDVVWSQWWRRLELVDLDLADPHECVIGQVVAEVVDYEDDLGGYNLACMRYLLGASRERTAARGTLERIGLTLNCTEGLQRGFHASYNLATDFEADCAQLTDAWRNYVYARRSMCVR
jgi:hypothetical protein